MKGLITRLLRFTGQFISYLLPPVLSKVVTKSLNTIRSGYLQRMFKACGANFSIEYPFYYVGINKITIGDNFIARSGLKIEAHSNYLAYAFNPEIIIGNNVSINGDCHIVAINKIVIGNDVLIASKVFIIDHFHGTTTDADSIKLPPAQRPLVSRGPVIIEDNVWLGESVTIMPGITIGKNSVVGANAVVTKSFPANSVIGGNPAKLIKTIE